MTLHHIIHVNIRVPAAQMVACRNFYCDLLGLEVGPRPPFASSGYWLYANQAPVVHLVVDESSRGLIGHGHDALDHVAFRATGLSATLVRLQACNVDYRISTVPTLDVIQVSFCDPLGVGIELSFEDATQIAARTMPGTSWK
jgi:catechol 2,3-dioxygenase-like lactoylglutathione lyase family enzyme